MRKDAEQKVTADVYEWRTHMNNADKRLPLYRQGISEPAEELECAEWIEACRYYKMSQKQRVD